MSKKFNRRDIIKLVGGGLAGMVFTPIPWKLIDDISIWTQNWSWIPVPPKGEINSKYSICTICTAGCGIRARCVAGQPVSLWGIKDHPVNDGALCPLGIGGHHLAYHPARLRHPVKLVNDNNTITTTETDRDDIITIIADNIANIGSGRSNEIVAALDNRPGRTISFAYRKLLADIPNGKYITTGSNGTDSMEGFSEITGENVNTFGFNIEKAKTIVSFGAPLMEGWGIPGRIFGAMKNGMHDKQFKLIQVEPRFSHSASVADQWIPVTPGTEAILALGIANVMINQNLIIEDVDESYKNLVADYTPQRVSEITGIKRELIVDTARSLANNGPALILCGREPAGGPFSREEQIAIWGLNSLLGNIGPDKMIVPRNSVPAGKSFQDTELATVTKFSDIPDKSIRVLIIDEAESGNAIPWQLIERKLVPDKALVVSLSPYLVGMTKRAHYVVPAPTHLESYQDIPPSFDARTSTFAVSAPMYTPPEKVTEPFEFLKLIAKKIGSDMPTSSYTDLIRERASEIHKNNRGWVYNPTNGRITETADILSERQFWGLLSDGGYWIDEPVNNTQVTVKSLFGSVGKEKLKSKLEDISRPNLAVQVKYPVMLVPFGWRGVVDSGPVTPLITKLYQESEFRQGTNRALIHPDTGSLYRLRENRPAKIVTEAGELNVQVEFNDSIRPGVVHVALGPDQDRITGVKEVKIKENVLSVSAVNGHGTWRSTPARIQTV